MKTLLCQRHVAFSLPYTLRCESPKPLHKPYPERKLLQTQANITCFRLQNSSSNLQRIPFSTHLKQPAIPRIKNIQSINDQIVNLVEERISLNYTILLN